MEMIKISKEQRAWENTGIYIDSFNFYKLYAFKGFLLKVQT